MKINRISVYQKTLPLTKPYCLSGGRFIFSSLDSTFIKIETDGGLVGWGEGCPWGHTYLPAYGGGIRSAAQILAPVLLGQNPRALHMINDLMDQTLPGHLYAKSPFDIACWDLAAQAAGLPLGELLGGRRDPVPIVSSIATASPAAMLDDIDDYRARGYFVHSAKIGGSDHAADLARIHLLEKNRHLGERIIYDVNRAWTPAQAITVMNSVREFPHLYFEQPCTSLSECKIVRDRTIHPVSIDERLETWQDFCALVQDNIGDIVNIKLGRVGGLTKAQMLMAAASAAGLELLVMDTGGTVVADTAAVHLAQTARTDLLIGSWLCQDLLATDPALPTMGARNHHGRTATSECVGLGVTPDESWLGEAVWSTS